MDLLNLIDFFFYIKDRQLECSGSMTISQVSHLLVLNLNLLLQFYTTFSFLPIQSCISSDVLISFLTTSTLQHSVLIIWIRYVIFDIYFLKNIVQDSMVLSLSKPLDDLVLAGRESEWNAKKSKWHT